MNTTHDTQQLIADGYRLLQSHRPNAIGTLSQKFPYRLTDKFYQIATKHRNEQLLSTSDINFLEVFINTPFRDLKHKAFLMGEWYDVKPRELKSYNLAFGGKTVSKCNGFRKR